MAKEDVDRVDDARLTAAFDQLNPTPIGLLKAVAKYFQEYEPVGMLPKDAKMMTSAIPNVLNLLVEGIERANARAE